MPTVSKKAKLIFTHVPKTGGGSLTRAIMEYDPSAFKYMSWHQALWPIKKKIDSEYPGFYHVTIVRNSFEALVSCYRFRNVKSGMAEDFPTFKQWLKNPEGHQYTVIGRKCVNQLDIIADKLGNILVDQIIYHDKYDEGIQELNSKLGINIVPNHDCHFYGTYDFRSYYDNETIDIVKKLCKKDIKYFNFKFE